MSPCQVHSNSFWVILIKQVANVFPLFLLRQREERERKIAESREQRQRMEDEQKERITRKLEVKASLKVQLAEERNKEEGEKKKIR